MYRVAYCVSHPIPYQVPLLRRLSTRPEIDLTVLFQSTYSARAFYTPGFSRTIEWDEPLLDGYRHQTLPSLGRADREAQWLPWPYGLRGILRAGRFDAVWIHGYANPLALQVLASAPALGIKVLLRGESHWYTGARARPLVALKRHVLTRLFERVDGFLAIGALNREFYADCGVEPERIFEVPYAVDNARLRARIADAAAQRETLRRTHELEPGRPIVLFAARFERRKRALDLLQAFRRAAANVKPRPYLLLVGAGEEEVALRAAAGDDVRFAGFRNQSELPAYYGLCDVFVLPSEREPWGLVVNEAMNAGVPVIVSDQVGSGYDLVRDGVNGFRYAVGDVQALAGRLEQLLRDPVRRTEMGRSSLEIVNRFSIDAGVQGLLDALESVVGADGVSAGIASRD